MFKKIIKKVAWVFVGYLCFFAMGCARQPGLQYGLRGNPNAPYQSVQSLYVDQNVIYAMTPSQFNEYKRRLDWATNYNGHLIRNDQQAANAAKAWVNEPNNYYNNGTNQIRNDLTRTFSNELSNGLSSIMRDLFD